ncbi:hypothetical protein BFR04_00055 [Gaetbulibacter sp. 4G1]|nr:hypothetical protein [Gaetbulibacter sp. 4G1]PIA79287.1 hypothetical protein BFR04_00055 [Gaetbulibacter sp. 4G1]
MKKLNSITLGFALFFMAFACDDILEKDISNDSIQVISPINGTVIEGNTVQFLWKNLDGVDDYRIQIIKKNQVYEVDSLVTSNVFTYTLNPGQYQWRIRGENFAYETPYVFPIDFETIASDDLANQSVSLQTPSENFYTSNKDIICSWNAVENANSYSFVLIKKLGGEQTVFQQEDIMTTSQSFDDTVLDEDAEYVWSVKAVNSTSETSFAERSFFVDTSTPSQPALSLPADEVIIDPSVVTFNWTNGADSGNIQSEITNTLEISTDVNFNTITHSVSTINNSAQYEFTLVNTYYWRVKAIDAANNQSDFSTIRSIIVE